MANSQMASLRNVLSAVLPMVVFLASARTNAAPGVFDLTSPANGAWCTATCTFTWQTASSAASYQLYVDAVLKKDAIAPTSPPAYTLAAGEALAEGLHTWYVVAKDSGGTPTQSSSTWSVRIDATPPAMFALLTPTNNSYVPSSPVTITWSPSSDAGSSLDHYEVWLNGAAVVTSISASTTSATMELPRIVVFQDVFATDCANWLVGSDGWSCYTFYDVNTGITTRELLWLAGGTPSGQTSTTSAINFSNVGQVVLKLDYRLSADTSVAQYATSFSDDGGSTWATVPPPMPRGDYPNWTSTSINLPAGGIPGGKLGFSASDVSNWDWWAIRNILVSGIVAGPYSWYVVAQDIAGNRTTSDTWQVRYDLPPTAFNLNAPADGTWTADTKPTLSWNAPTDGGAGLAKYQLWVDAALAIDNIAVGATSAKPTNALTDGMHSWQIYAVDAAGAVRKSRQTWNIGVDTTPPVAFSLNSPADKNTSTIPTPTLCWNTASDAGSGLDHYQLFIDGSLNRDGISSTCSTPTATLAQGAHTWSVKAIDGVGNSRDATQTWTVYVDFNPPGPFSIIGPGNSDGYEVVKTATPTFMWQPSSSSGSGLDHYELYLSNLGRPWVCAECSIPSTSTSVTVTNPIPDGYYSWTVKAVDHIGGSTMASANSQSGTGGIEVLCAGTCGFGPEPGLEPGPEPTPEPPRDAGIDAPADSGQDGPAATAAGTGTSTGTLTITTTGTTTGATATSTTTGTATGITGTGGTTATSTNTKTATTATGGSTGTLTVTSTAATGTVTTTGTVVSPEPQHDAAPPITVADAANPDLAIRAETAASRDGIVMDAVPGADTTIITSKLDAFGFMASDGGLVLADAAAGGTRDAGVAGRDGGHTGSLDGAGSDGAATTTKASGGCGCVVGGGNTGSAGFWPLLVLGFLALWRGVRPCRRRG